MVNVWELDGHVWKFGTTPGSGGTSRKCDYMNKHEQTENIASRFKRSDFSDTKQDTTPSSCQKNTVIELNMDTHTKKTLHPNQRAVEWVKPWTHNSDLKKTM